MQYSVSRKSVGSLTDSSKQCSFSFLWWLSIQVLLCCWFSRTRISAQFRFFFLKIFCFFLPNNIPLWKECKKNLFLTDGELKQRLFSCGYTAYLNQNQTHALFPKVTPPASPRLLYNPIMGGIATNTQLPSWSALLKMWARFESAADVMSCFDLGLCKSFQKGRRGTITITPKKQPERQLGAGLKYVTNELIAWHYKKRHQKTFCILVLLFRTISQHCWSIFIFAWPSHALWSPMPHSFPPQLCWHLPRLSHPLQPKLFFTPRLWWRCHRALQAGRFLLCSSQAPPASSARCHRHIYHGETHANRKHNGLTHLFPLVIDNLSWLS